MKYEEFLMAISCITVVWGLDPNIINFAFSAPSAQFGDSITISAEFKIYDPNGGTCLLDQLNAADGTRPLNSDFIVTSTSIGSPPTDCIISDYPPGNYLIPLTVCMQVSESAQFQLLTANLTVNTAIRIGSWPFTWTCVDTDDDSAHEIPTQSLIMKQPQISMIVTPSISTNHVPQGTSFNVSVYLTNTGTGIFASNVICSAEDVTGITLGGVGLSAACSITGSSEFSCSASAANLSPNASEHFIVPMTYSESVQVSVNITCFDESRLFDPVSYLLSLTPPPPPTPSPRSKGPTGGGSTSTVGNGGSTTTTATTTTTGTDSSANNLSIWLNRILKL